MGRNARKRATREFSVERHIEQVEALYDDLLAR
jgi:hypothetical protein